LYSAEQSVVVIEVAAVAAVPAVLYSFLRIVSSAVQLLMYNPPTVMSLVVPVEAVIVMAEPVPTVIRK